MTIRVRILILLTVLAVLFLSGIWLLNRWEARHIALLARNDHREKAAFFSQILTLKGASLEALAYDYTYWDEMVSFVRTHDPKWSSQNLDSALSTYNADGIWVYDRHQTLIYSTCSSGNEALKQLPIKAEDLRRATGKKHFCHFFIPTPKGLLELRGADIHATKDEKRSGPSYGVFLTGRVWNQAYLHTLSGLTVSQVILRPLTAGAPVDMTDRVDDFVDYFQLLRTWDGDQIALLHLKSESSSVQIVRSSNSRLVLLVLGFISILLALLSVCLVLWVSRPLDVLSRCLRTHDTERLDWLRRQRTEFGLLARLMGRFFVQQTALEEAHDRLEARVAERTAELADSNRLLEDAYTATILGWSRAMDLRDHETEGHCQRVTEMTLRLGRCLGMPQEELIPIRWGALLHDIGKMGVPDHILRKGGALTEEEWEEMRKHPQYAYDMLAPIAFLRSALEIPLCHHEKWDGTGYPRGLVGDEIPLAARMFAIVDVWDALRSDRPYRRGWPPEQIVDHVCSLAGTHFDPFLVPEFLASLSAEDFQPHDLNESAPLRLVA